jgi:glutamyl-tRNA reductase
MAGEVTTPASAASLYGGIPLARSPDDPRSIERLRLASFERNLWQVGIAELEETVEEVTGGRVREWFESDSSVLEAALLRTCQRILVLAVFTTSDGPDRWSARLAREAAWTVRTDIEAIRHLYDIAAGLDSRAPGEREVRDQVRATAAGVLSRAPRRLLANLLERAAEAPSGLPPTEARSVADLAAEWLRPRLSGRPARVLVIGAGTVGRRAAEQLAPDSHVTLIYRSHPPDPEWARRWGVEARPTTALTEALRTSDAVIAAAKTTGRVLAEADLPGEPGAGPRWFVDLGLPRNVDPRIGLRPGSQLVDLGGLPRGRLSPERLALLRRTISAASEEGVDEFARASVEPWVSELRRRAESIRSEELERALAHAGPLTDAARLALERFSDRLVRRLLAGPTAELRGLPPGPEVDLLRRRVVELFETADPRP